MCLRAADCETRTSVITTLAGFLRYQSAGRGEPVILLHGWFVSQPKDDLCESRDMAKSRRLPLLDEPLGFVRELDAFFRSSRRALEGLGRCAA